MSNNPTLHCPLCNRKLVQKKSGYVCKNPTCNFYWKLGGWSLITPGSLVWAYTDNNADKHICWDKAHGYPPRKEKIRERHFDAMNEALRKNEDLCFIIPLRYCLPDSEVVPEE